MGKFSSVARKIFLTTPLAIALSSAVTVNIPINAPSGAPTVSGSLFSLSLEQDRWLDWAGSTSRNQFFFNTLDNLIKITGEAPQIRIGADSEDHTDFGRGVQGAQAVFPAPSLTVPFPEASTVVVGDAYYEAARFLPRNTHVIWGVNFGTNNITAAFLEAQAIQRAFSSSAVTNAGVILDFVEIGNEADLYTGNGHRSPGTFNISEYVREWTTFATNVSAAAGISSSSHVKFWGGAFAGSSHSNSGFSPQAIFNNGIRNSAAGKLIQTISQHHYSGSFCSGNGGLLQDLMTKSTIRSNLSQFIPDATFVRNQGLDYVLGETNSYACHGAPGVSNVAGAALWALDYALFAREVGATRVFFHEGIGYKYNLIQPATLTRSPTDGSTLPDPLPPHVQPPYYAAIIAAEAVGNTGNTQLTELMVNNPRISGYGFFVRGKITRAVFINSEAFLTTTTAQRTSVHVDLNFGNGGPTTMSVKRLTIQHADDTSGLTWGGVSYETPDARPNGQESMQTVDVSDGFDIKATEVVMLSFQ